MGLLARCSLRAWRPFLADCRTGVRPTFTPGIQAGTGTGASKSAGSLPHSCPLACYESTVATSPAEERAGTGAPGQVRGGSRTNDAHIGPGIFAPAALTGDPGNYR